MKNNRVYENHCKLCKDNLGKLNSTYKKAGYCLDCWIEK